MLAVNDMLVDCSIKDAAEQAKSTKSELHFGQYTCANGWFFKKNISGLYSGFKAIDVCWVYPRNVKHSIVPIIGIIPIPIPLGTTFDVACKLSTGTEIILSNANSTESGEKIPANTVGTFQQLQSLIPWAIFGYSPFLKECWEERDGLFLEVHNNRLTSMREGLRNGNIIVQPNGSLAFLSEFTLPTIAMKFEKNQKGKLERVYYQAGAMTDTEQILDKVESIDLYFTDKRLVFIPSKKNQEFKDMTLDQKIKNIKNSYAIPYCSLNEFVLSKSRFGGLVCIKTSSGLKYLNLNKEQFSQISDLLPTVPMLLGKFRKQ